MLQEQKVSDVNKKRLTLSLLLIIIATVNLNSTFAQVQSFEFQKSFIRNFRYPKDLTEKCTSTFTNLQITVSSSGKLGEMLISDSASESFKSAFNAIKINLDTIILKQIIEANKLKGCYIIIPIFYVYASDYCTNSFEPIGYLNDNYVLFKGRTLTKMSYIMKPIMISMYKPLQ
ncbi:hypothetical protein QE417_003571 [Mucilaginibacter terrae]|uniref:Uncharacterized protein n=1 Tax=Mucilaginibacter terrae TaxID=1955052 RepID=A0ABU3GXL1_9SPHI|nr:hypothetical protein [Mucilaginibacter terrae]